MIPVLLELMHPIHWVIQLYREKNQKLLENKNLVLESNIENSALYQEVLKPIDETYLKINFSSIILPPLSEDINNKKLKNKINEFESNKENILAKKTIDIFKNDSILNSSGKINMDSLYNDIVKLDETYYYDYNINKLMYKLNITKNIIGNVKTEITKKIDL